MITIIGSGKFGKAISHVLLTRHTLVDVETDGTYSEETKRVINTSEALIVCVPSAYLENCAEMLKKIVKAKQPILCCTKGLFSQLRTPTEILEKVLSNDVATLNGPNLSSEMMADKPTITTIAGKRAQYWTKHFDRVRFLPVIERDAVGCEFGAAAKNIIAVGAGFIDGYFGSCNTMGSFVGLAANDLMTLYRHKTGRHLPHLSFYSDLFATSMSEESRNHHYGHEFGTAVKHKKTLPKVEGTIEGLRALDMVVEYCRKNKIELTAIDALNATLALKEKPETILLRSLG